MEAFKALLDLIECNQWRPAVLLKRDNTVNLVNSCSIKNKQIIYRRLSSQVAVTMRKNGLGEDEHPRGLGDII